jgi:hypothetical protein
MKCQDKTNPDRISSSALAVELGLMALGLVLALVAAGL